MVRPGSAGGRWGVVPPTLAQLVDGRVCLVLSGVRKALLLGETFFGFTSQLNVSCFDRRVFCLYPGTTERWHLKCGV